MRNRSKTMEHLHSGRGQTLGRTAVIVAALGFFIAYRFLITATLWNGRSIPPEPDDSYTYISAARSIIEQGEAIPDTISLPKTSSERTKALPYSLTLAALSTVTGLTVEQVYHLTFYLGTVVLAFVLFVLLRLLTQRETLAAVLLVLLALFNGEGGYHGFFWVVPSFFSLIGFFWITALLLAPYRHAVLLLAISIPSFALVHPFGAYVTGVFVAFAALLMLFQRRVERELLKRTGITVVMVIVTVLSLTVFQRIRGIGAGPTADVGGIIGTVVSSGHLLNADSWKAVQTLYLAPLVPHLLPGNPVRSIALGALFLLGLLALVRLRQWRVLALFGAGVVFGALALLSPFGGRTLLYLWPLTFLVIGASTFWVLPPLLKTRFPLFIRLAVVVLLGLLPVEATLSSVATVQQFNEKANMPPLSPAAIAFLRTNTSPGERILFADKFSETYVIRGGNLTDRAPVPLLTTDWTNPAFANSTVLGNLRYVIATDSSLKQTIFQNQLNAFLRAHYRITRGIDAPRIWYANHLTTTYTIDDTRTFGYLKIYEIKGALTEDDLRPLL